jgi:hypothetical protein
MKTVKIEEVYNGFQLTLVDDSGPKRYVFPSTREHEMLVFIGKFILNCKIKVERV